MPELRTSSPVLVLVERGGAEGQFALELHATWRTFMLPVTSSRELKDEAWGVHVQEQPADAASRAVAESLGILVRRDQLRALPPLHVTEVSQSQGQVTGYHFQMFAYRVPADAALQPAHPLQWLTLEQMLDPELAPISPMARAVARKLLEQRLNG